MMTVVAVEDEVDVDVLVLVDVVNVVVDVVVVVVVVGGTNITSKAHSADSLLMLDVAEH